MNLSFMTHQRLDRAHTPLGSGIVSADGVVTSVVFDVGGVLLDWDPRYLYRRLLPDDAAVEGFLARVCTPEWNLAQDAGRSWQEAVAERTARFPEHAALIRAYDERWTEMVRGPFQESVEVLTELRDRGVSTYALTNFSTEKWQLTLETWPFLRAMAGAVVSGAERLTKPDPRIYHRLLDRFGLEPAATFYTDDVQVNVEAARRVGLHAERFTGGGPLRTRLVELGVLPADPTAARTVD